MKEITQNDAMAYHYHRLTTRAEHPLPKMHDFLLTHGRMEFDRPVPFQIGGDAMGERAECVMLNKGPHLPLAVRTLDDILRRMQQHQHKKRSMLRPLRVAGAEAGPGARESGRWAAVDAASADTVVDAVGARPASVVGARPGLAPLACVRERDAEVAKATA